jgi:hypothetical protein
MITPNPKIAQCLDRDRLELLDLSLRNPLLNYESTKRRTPRLGLIIPDESSLQVLRLLVQEGRAFSFQPAPRLAASPAKPSPITPPAPQNAVSSSAPSDSGGEPAVPPNDPAPHAPSPGTKPPGGPATPDPDSRDTKLNTQLDPEELTKRLTKLERNARASLEERGVNTLFLALGMLDWTTSDAPSDVHRAPLVLIPVKLERTSIRERFRLKHTGDDPLRNLSLAEKLRIDFRLDLPAWDEEEGLDLDSYFAAVENLIKEQPGWSVDRNAIRLGFFSFTKFLMYNDLAETTWPDPQRPSIHPILRSLIEGRFQEPPPAAAENDPLDPVLARVDPCLVLDSDASQSLAILDVVAGRSLVIQGPPGTGKSQAITNLIADAIHRGRTVLFVAEKLAALEVVKRRLDHAGLGNACLELHSHNANRKAVVSELARTAQCDRPAQGAVDASQNQDLLEMDRKALRDHVTALHTPLAPSGISPYQAVAMHFEAESLRGAAVWPKLELPAAPSWTSADRERHAQAIHGLEQASAALGLPAEQHLFWGVGLLPLLPADLEALRNPAQEASQALHLLDQAREAAKSAFGSGLQSGLEGIQSFLAIWSRLRQLASIGGIDPSAGFWRLESRSLESLVDRGRTLAALHAAFDSRLLPHAWDAEVTDLRQTLDHVGRAWYRWLAPSYWKARGKLRRLCRGKPPRKPAERVELLDAIITSQSLRAAIEKDEPLGSRAFGSLWRADRSDWDALGTVLSDVQAIQVAAEQSQIDSAALAAVADPTRFKSFDDLVRPLDPGLAAARQKWESLVQRLQLDPAVASRLTQLPLDQLAEKTAAWSQKLEDLPPLLAWNQAARQAREIGLEPLIPIAASWLEAPRLLQPLVNATLADALIRQATSERAELARFNGLTHEQRIARFTQRDRAALEANRIRAALKHWEALPRQNVALGQLAILRREFEKKARHLPVRQLITKAGLAVQAIKPVFLMSPLSVATYLPPGSLSFDLVIFDEASQVRPVDAYGALLRAKQAVVVGDKQQLPPTAFFDRLVSDDAPVDDEDASAGAGQDLESILGLFDAAGAPSRMLRWHYRSRHESLITVSNQQFYQNRLVVFPSPCRDANTLGLSLRFLPDARYDRGKTRTNPQEADAVARAVVDFARAQLSFPVENRQTLGVAAFSLPQAEAIADRVDALRAEEPDLDPFFAAGGPEPFFVKNLESVQGDERDVIFLSIGYARSADGSLPMNFGPLNAAGGQRRLNVLISRAKRRMVVFTALRSDEIDTSRTAAEGVHALKTFLAFAESQDRSNSSPQSQDAPGTTDGSLADHLVRKLAEAGFPADRAVGSSDGRVEVAVLDPDQPDQYLLAIETDGPPYTLPRTTTDRDRLREQVLRGLGWSVHHVWTFDWLYHSSQLWERLLLAIADARKSAAAARENAAQLKPATPPRQTPPASPDHGESGAPNAPSPSPGKDQEKPKPDPRLKEASPPPQEKKTAPASSEPDSPAIPYSLAHIKLKLPRDTELPDANPDAIAHAVAQVVEQEGPIHVTEACRRVADAAGVKRMGSRIQDALDAAIDRAIRGRSIVRKEDFLWPADCQIPPLRDRSELPAASRKPELVPPEEWAAAVARLVADSLGATPEELAPAVARLLGFPRTSEDIASQVESALARLIAAGAIQKQGDHLVARPAQEPPDSRFV